MQISEILRKCATCMFYKQMQTQERLFLYELPCWPWEVVSAGIFMIVDYYGKFPVVKKVDRLAADDKMIFAEYGLPKKIISDAGTPFTSETFKKFCRQMSIQQSITSSYHCQNNCEVEAYTKNL